MQSRRVALACLLGALSVEKSPAAEVLPEPSNRTVKSDSLRLIQEDIRIREEAKRAKPTPAGAAKGAGEVLDLPTLVVKEKEPPKLPPPPPREQTVEKLLRTGTIWESRPGGVKLWMKGDKGLMLTFPF